MPAATQMAPLVSWRLNHIFSVQARSVLSGLSKVDTIWWQVSSSNLVSMGPPRQPGRTGPKCSPAADSIDSEDAARQASPGEDLPHPARPRGGGGGLAPR